MTSGDNESSGGVLDDLALFRARPDEDVSARYDRAASRYDHFRALWLRLAGAGAEAARLEDLRTALHPGARVLDAGCGTGALARRIVELEPTAELTLIDASAEMLARSADVPGRHLKASVLDLPLPDASFDLVVSAWVIETVDDPHRAVQEYLRVLAPGGVALYTFCSLPEGWFSRAGSSWLRFAVDRGFAGDFLDAERTPWHDCAISHRARFQHGLTTEVALGSCCAVLPPPLPA